MDIALGSEPKRVPDALYALVGHHQGLAGRHHARAVQEALAKVELGEGELEARFHSCALNHKDECWPKFHLKRGKNPLSTEGLD